WLAPGCESGNAPILAQADVQRKPLLHALIAGGRSTIMLRIAFVGLTALASTLAWGQSLIERGSYLVNAVMACDGCHTPRGPAGFVMEKRFSGGSQTWDDPAYTVKGSNITPDPDTGIGRWSESDIKISLTEGLRPHGMPLAPQIPF